MTTIGPSKESHNASVAARLGDIAALQYAEPAVDFQADTGHHAFSPQCGYGGVHYDWHMDPTLVPAMPSRVRPPRAKRPAGRGRLLLERMRGLHWPSWRGLRVERAARKDIDVH